MLDNRNVCPHLLTVFSKFCNLLYCPHKKGVCWTQVCLYNNYWKHCIVWCLSHSFSWKRYSLPRVLSSSCEILTNWVTQSGRKCAYHEGWYTVTYIFYKQFFFIVLPPLKIYFSCASTVTSLHDSLSSTYECLLIVACSQFLGSVSCCLFFWPSSCFQGVHDWMV